MVFQSIWLIDDNFGTGLVRADFDPDQTFEPFRDRCLFLGLNEQQHKTAAAGAEKFSTDGARIPGGLIYFIDFRSRYDIRKFPFELPGIVQQFPDLPKRPVFRLQNTNTLVNEPDHGLDVLLASIQVVDLLLGDFWRKAGKPVEKEHQMVEQGVLAGRKKGHRLDIEPARPCGIRYG